MAAKKLTRTRATTRVKLNSTLRVYVFTNAAFSIAAAGLALGLVFFGQSWNNTYLSRVSDVTITDGVYAAPDGDVPFRMCAPENIKRDFQYPTVLFAPGQTIQLDYWTPHCIYLANKGYIVFMKSRIGENYGQWQEEVDAAVEYLTVLPEVDETRIAAMANSFGAQEIQSSGVSNSSQFKAFIDDSGYNNPQVMREDRSLSRFDIPTITLSGGGERPEGQRDCDYDGFTWTSAFADKFRQENPDYFESQNIFTMEEYGCVRHGYLWDYRSEASGEARRIIVNFLDETLGREPTPIASQ